MNKTYLLEALCLLLSLFGSLCSFKALFEKLQCLVKFISVLELNSNFLIDSHKLLTNLILYLLLVAIYSFLQGCLKVIHSFEDVEDLLLANTQTHVSLSFTLHILEIDGHIKTLLVEIGGCFEVIQLFKLVCDIEV